MGSNHPGMWWETGADAAPAKPKAPQSAYTKDVAARGVAAVADRRAARQFGPTTSQDALRFSLGTGQQTTPNSSLFDEWAQAYAPRDYDVSYGRSPEGKYAGFKNEGTMWSAVNGRAQSLRDEAQSVFDRLYQDAGSNLDRTEQDFTTSAIGANRSQNERSSNAVAAENARREQEHAQLTAPGWGAGVTNGSPFAALAAAAVGNARRRDLADEQFAPLELADSNSSGVGYSTAGVDGYGGSTMPQSAAGGQTPVMADRQATSKALAELVAPIREDVQGYRDDLSGWLAENSDRYLGQQEFAQQGAAAPLSLYAARSGADYGIDPMLVQGKYGPSVDNTDFRATRDAQSIAQSGMPYGELQSAIGGLASEQDKMATEQTQADEAAMADGVAQATGVDGVQLAQTANSTLARVYDLVANPGFSDLQAALDQIVNDGTDTVVQQEAAQQAVVEAGATDTEYRSLLRALYPELF